MLSASGSTDPDGDDLEYNWIYYREVGSLHGWIDIKNRDKQRAYFIAPNVINPKSIHIILVVTDNGEPVLTRYQRVIIILNPCLSV